MYALRVARKLYGHANGAKRKLIRSSKRKLSIRGHYVSARSLIRQKQKSTPTLKSIHQTNARDFRASPAPRWQTPEHLSTSELRKECERRQIATKGSRTALIERLNQQISHLGGYDNGLTTDDALASEKRAIESQMNKIKDAHFSQMHLYVEERFQKKIAAQFASDARVTLHADSASHIRLEGRYADICSLRALITEAVAERSARETIYSLPHHVVLRLKRSILADIRRTHNVNFSIMRHKHNGEDMMLVAVEGDTVQRLAACDALEAVISKIKSHSLDVPGLESYAQTTHTEKSATLAALSDLAMKGVGVGSSGGSGLRESVSDCFNVFSGVVLYLDPRMREMMQDYASRLSQIGADTACNVYLGNRDLFWLNDFQLAIEGTERADIERARQQIDALMNHLKSLTMTLVLPPSINEDMAAESKQLAGSIQKQLGVDTVIIQQNDFIYVHLIGSVSQVNSAAGIIDSRSHRLHKLSGANADAERLLRRERIRTLNFLDYGVGGLDDSLRDMLRRTFESRLISKRLRKELALQHIRGVLLYGPPGTGKTLVARKISEILGCKAPKIVNGPEVESKWVGEAEKNIRALFEEAQAEFEEKGEDNSDLHVIIFDEIDAIAKKRGGAHAKSRDGALNQLLCCLDGVESLDNVLVVGLTNRKDCLDPALLRPGRLEVQLDIGLPDAKGREDILKIHTDTMRQHGRLAADVDLQVLAQMSDDFSGADLSGMIRSAVSFALEDMDDEDEVLVTQELLQRGLHEVRFARERLPTDEEPESNFPGLLQA